MSDFPINNQPITRASISSDGRSSCGALLRAINATAAASGTYPAANRAIYVPFTLPTIATVYQMWTLNGGTATGNIDVGIYDTGGNLIVSKGSTAQSGTSTLQLFDITDTTLNPGLYYMAIATNSASSTFVRYAPAAQLIRAIGVLSQSTAFALPSTATYAAAQDAFLPVFGLTMKATI